MIFYIHDVGHGFCAHLQHENGHVMLWDCGHKSEPEYRPSVFLPEMGVYQIDRFFVTNFDEDHISDLPNLRTEIPIRSLHRNRSISADQLRALKLQGGPLSTAMHYMLDMLNEYHHVEQAYSVAPFPDVDFSVYCCNYPDFMDTNNISLVTFLKARGTTFLIPGDIERPAWERLLTDPNFCIELTSVDVFIASHHGRQNGYCSEVFQYCTPKLIVFSDSAKQFSTQEMTATYAAHASGMEIDGSTRYVYTTRSGGSIYFNR